MLVLVIFFAANNNNASFKFKQKTTRKTATGGTKDAEKMMLLKHLSNFWIIKYL